MTETAWIPPGSMSEELKRLGVSIARNRTMMYFLNVLLLNLFQQMT